MIDGARELSPIARAAAVLAPRAVSAPVNTVIPVILRATEAESIGAPMRVGGLRIVDRAIRLAAGSPILGQDVLAEQVALRGGTIEIGNPLDAFPRRAQSAYVDFLLGEAGGDADVNHARVVLVQRHGSAEKRLAHNPRFAAVDKDAHAVLFVRRAKAAG